MPWTPWRSTSSASLNASVIGVRLSTTCMSRSLGMVMSVSTRPCRLAMPSSAARCRLRPSNLNGLVTTPMVSAPCSRAISAIAGAAPVPVPPPMPAVTNTMSQSSSSLVSSSRVSSAASRAAHRVAAGAQPAGQLGADAHLLVRIAELQRLVVGVDRDELDALEAALDHAVDGVAAAAADADHLDAGISFQRPVEIVHGRLLTLPALRTQRKLPRTRRFIIVATTDGRRRRRLAVVEPVQLHPFRKVHATTVQIDRRRAVRCRSAPCPSAPRCGPSARARPSAAGRPPWRGADR